MDAAVWDKSQRKSFPFNINLSYVIVLSLLTPLAVFVLPIGKSYVSWDSVRILLITIAISIMAYHVSNKLIMGFKDILCQKGLFGKDLNKAGERETKEKV
jgi:hypothetical protein